MTYLALLRGINSGKNPSTKMADLKQLFEDIGFTNVKTIIASGNVLFDTEQPKAGKKDVKKLESQIESAFEKEFGFHSAATMRNLESIQKLYDSNPFKNIKITDKTRPYATFLPDPKAAPKDISYPITGDGYQILGEVEGAICSVVDLTTSHTVDLMAVLDKTYGKDVTTRGWKTIERIMKK